VTSDPPFVADLPDEGEFFLIGRWHGERYRSIDLDGFSKWIMKDDTVINRKPSAEEGQED
jgi:hypothetical protein